MTSTPPPITCDQDDDRAVDSFLFDVPSAARHVPRFDVYMVMLIRSPSILAAAVSSLPSFQPGACVSSTTSVSQRWNRGTRSRQCRQEYGRRYATVVSGAGETRERPANNEEEWPKPAEGRTCPTPYQIFCLKRNETYSKNRFYELVKIYHPDRVCGPDETIPHHTRVERYRLIVAAHTILSDPMKRSAYDRFGAGWDGRAEVGRHGEWHSTSPYHQPGPFSHSWTNRGDPIWQNATWEDWEQFHAKQAGTSPQQPVYLQNSYFLAVVVVMAFIGSTLNLNRAQDAGTYFIEQRDIVHDQAAKELRKIKQDVQGRGRDERIQWFLRQREAQMGLVGADPEVVREEKADKLLPERDICRSEDISGKGG